MASRIPESFITEVRQKVNIVDVIGQYTDLVKRGRQWNGSCPFHDDHHPSLFVEENKQVFNCFSCGRSGSVFSFLMEKEGMSYPEAILSLAESADMHVDSSISAGVTQQVDSTTQVVYQLHTAAQRLYQHILLNTTSGEQALAYLHEKRQLTDDIIKHFGIGFVPEDNALLNYATEQNISREMMRTSELFISNDQSELRDRFSGRIVWPIKTERGQVVGFSGRALNANNNIKYMNSPESPFFTKGKILYNFDLAKNQIRQTNTVMIFEGFMDVISASMAEKPVGVATMGTALTRDHVRQLSHVAKRILLVYDGDEAGQNAARRSIDLIREYAKNVDIGVVYLPDHLDPDEVRVQRGLPVLKQTLEQNIQTPVEFLVNAARVGKNLSNQVQYLAFLQEVMKTLKSASPVEQDIQLTRIANEFGTSKHALQTQLQQSVNQKANKSQQTYSTMVEPPVHSNDYDIGLRQTDINQSITQVEQAERALIMAMIKSPQVMIQVKETAGFAFVHPDYQLLMMLTNIYQTQHPGDFDLAQYMDFIQKPELNQKIMAIDRSYGDIAIEKAAINDYLRVIMHDAPIDARIRELQQAINTAKQQHDDAKLLQFMTELINIKKQQSEL
ncbi:MAG: DNA primase [Leuconostoc gelidum]|jgi:DNA primase|uniref:DNA primase n=1 Tax=Leuconostoc gelidum subsp. gelidum TaxID=1607839 RepID=A0AB35FZS7_LEUGE|nr:DNA primase [Leuconostoc gelidum]MBZ5963590.1 DNA primase [Leuconostoc gelidum subsp. gelidum]MBZ5975568.1 DNA primase [Leuconostoc gelidum subsp. gelidum]MBZ5976264.1 DNA primase [Leuconostoc gelidum subsp. gelidum]MBZ5987047.1 DNA primase [Leuconostoc gelidum subsp. gelidum]MBZ6000244.1 DNA primase [Leuconostoc gelidum subsp. gelidum]